MELTKENKAFMVKLEEWDNFNNQVCDIQDAVATLTDKNPKAHAWSINFLMCDLVKAAEDRRDAFHDLEKFGVVTYEDAQHYAIKYLLT
jgi:hypothetical protein